MGCEFSDVVVFGARSSKGQGEPERRFLNSVLYIAGEAQQTLIMSDRTLTLDSLQGGVGYLEVEFDSLFQYL